MSDLAMRQRIEARANQPRVKEVASPAFSATVRQADMGAGCYQITTVMGDGSKYSRSAIGNPKLLADAEYDSGALGCSVMVSK
jgi:hypothetical protein